MKIVKDEVFDRDMVKADSHTDVVTVISPHSDRKRIEIRFSDENTIEVRVYDAMGGGKAIVMKATNALSFIDTDNWG